MNQRVSPETLPKLHEMDGLPCPERGNSGKVAEEMIFNPCFSEESQEKTGCLTGEQRLSFTSDRSSKVQGYRCHEIRAAWSNSGQESMKSTYTCNCLAFLAVFLMSVASLLLTVLMLFGKVGPPNQCGGCIDKSGISLLHQLALTKVYIVFSTKFHTVRQAEEDFELSRSLESLYLYVLDLGKNLIVVF